MSIEREGLLGALRRAADDRERWGRRIALDSLRVGADIEGVDAQEGQGLYAKAREDARIIRELSEKLEAMDAASIDDPAGAHEMYLAMEDWITRNLR